MEFRIKRLFLLLLVINHSSGYLTADSFDERLPCHVDNQKIAHDMILFANSSFEQAKLNETHKNLFLIISNLNNSFPERLQKKLDKHPNRAFMSVNPNDFVINRKMAYQAMIKIDSAKFIKILIYLEKLDDLPQILKNFTNIFDGVPIIQKENKYNIAFTLKNTQEWNIGKVEKKLQQIIDNYESVKIAKLAKILLDNAKEFAFFDNISEEKRIDNIIDNLDYTPKEIYLNWEFNQQLRDIIICAVSELASDMSPWKIFADWVVTINNEDEFQLIQDELNNTTDIATYISKAFTILIQNSNLKPFTNPTFYQNLSRINYFLSMIPNMYQFSPLRNRWSKELEKLWKSNKFPYSIFMNVTKNCIKMKKGYKLQLKGNNLRFSDLNLTYCSDNIGFNDDLKFIELFASNKIVIDKDLILIGKAIQVAIFAPNWTIVGKRTINLNGADGKPHEESRAKDGVEKGFMNGAHGLAGLPGGPAGHFYGLVNKIRGAKYLTILANGGNGGSGQEGGMGANGTNGETYQNYPVFNCPEDEEEAPDIPGWIAEIMFLETAQKYWDSYYDTRHYKVFGKPGIFPGRGGNGGAGGIGGKGGEIIIEQLFEDMIEKEFILSSTNGITGHPGIRGSNGRGGCSGREVYVDCRNNRIQISIQTEPSEDVSIDPGKDGASLKMRKMPNKSIILQNYPNTLNEYKQFVRSEMVKLKDNLHLMAFYEELENDWELNNKYDTMSLVEEFIGLEQDYFYFYKQLNLSSSYKILARRLEHYGKKPYKEDERTEEYKIVLNYLHRIVTTKLSSSDLNKPLIYPVKTNIRRAFTNLGLNPVEASKHPEDIASITGWIEDNIRPLEEKIEKVQYMIDVVIKNAMDDLETTLNQEVEALLKEITTLKNDRKDRSAELNKSREQLKNFMILNSVFGVLKCGLAVAGIVNPMARVAIFASSSFIGTSVINTDNKTEAKAIPKAVKLANEAIEKFLQEKKEKEDKVIGEQEKFVQKMKDEIAPYAGDLISKFWNISSVIRNSEKKSFQDKGADMMKVYDQKENEITSQLRDAVDEGDENRIIMYQAVLRVVHYLVATSQSIEIGSETIIGFMRDNGKENEICEEILRSRENVRGLDNLKGQIYNIADSMMQNLMKFLSDNEFERINENDLILIQWNVMQNLKKMKFLMKKMINGLQISEEMKWCFDKLSENFDIMTKINDQFLGYLKEKNDKFFNAGLYIDTSYLNITDSKLRNAVAELQMLISYNTISESYDEWIFAFKQFGFPTAGFVLGNLELPNISRNENIEDIVRRIRENIKDFKNILDDDRFDVHFKNRKNQTFSGGKNAFNIWKKENFSKEIEQILIGDEAVLVAKIDLQKSPNALKFNKLKILFTSTNPEIQQSIYHVLQDFGVKLKHNGDSKYRCNNNIYEIKTTSTEMEYSFVNSTEDGRWHSSAMYSEIQNGEFVLSPYATWSIQLTTLDPQNFKKLKQYIGQVNLELIGQGQFLYDPYRECPGDMEKYYTKIL